MLQIYNTLTRRKEDFKPNKKGEINMYVCGMTVYDYCHIGHGRLFVVFDMVRRYLASQNYNVKFVCNITDIDDKIIKRSQENNEEYFALTKRFITAMHEDREALNVLPPTVEPRATEFIPQIIDLIKTLIDKGYAYKASNGDIYYQVSKFKNYGQLAQQDIEKLRAGERVEIVDAKQDPLDFALWKMSKPNEPSWDSPWGKGRPGWHTECVAMSINLLGENFDIHGGGLELQFPHHTNEIAQSEAATEKKIVNYWMHMGHVQVDKEKMSKSLGNFFTIREVLAKYNPEVVRYFLLASHYRSPVNYSAENLNSAQAALERFYTALRDLKLPEKINTKDEFNDRFVAAMDDDFNTPIALSVMFDMAREINRLKEEKKLTDAAQLAAALKQKGEILGILYQQPEKFLQRDIKDSSEIEHLITQRNQARQQKNWQEADRIRKQLTEMGVALEDTAAGTSWRKE